VSNDTLKNDIIDLLKCCLDYRVEGKSWKTIGNEMLNKVSGSLDEKSDKHKSSL
jgi:hypothetical protein